MIENIENLGIIVDRRLIKLYKVIIKKETRLKGKKQPIILLQPCRALLVFYQQLVMTHLAYLWSYTTLILKCCAAMENSCVVLCERKVCSQKL